MKHTILRTMKAAVSALAVMGMSLVSPHAALAQDRSIQILVNDQDVPNKAAADLYRAGLDLIAEDDWVGARLKWQAGANLGNPSSMGMLAQIYIMGIGVSTDTERGLDLAERAAELGNNIGKFLLGKAYLRGEGREVNIALGIQLTSEAIDGDFAKQYPNELWLASVLHNRAATKTQSDEEARRLFGYSADLLSRITHSVEHGKSAVDILLSYYGDHGLLTDLDKLYEVAAPASQNGHLAAAWWMSVWHINKLSEGGSVDQARFWAEQAAAGGYERAFAWLATFYELGIGGPRNLEEACRLNAKAMDAGAEVSDDLSKKCVQ